MPRKKKSAAQSPARTPVNSSDSSTSTGNDVALPSREPDNMGSSNFQTSRSGKEEILSSMLEMFSHLDSEVIYMVLSECDFKAEVAMDILLELSNAAEGAVVPAPLSGFESAAALLGQSKHDGSGAESRRKQNPPTKGSVFVSVNETKSTDSFGTHLTEDFDSLIEYEFETIFKKPHHSDLPSSASSSSNELPELIKSSLCNYSTDDQHISTEEQPADNTQHHGNLNLAVLAGQIPSQPDQASSGGSMLTDFSYLVKEVESDKPPLSFSNDVTSVAFKGSKYNSNPFSMKSKTVSRYADNNGAFGGFPFTDTPHHEHRINGNSGTNEQIHFKLPNTDYNIQTALGNGNDCNIWPSEIHLPGPHMFITPVAMSPVWRSGLNLRPSGRAAPHLNSAAFTPASWGGQHGTQPVSSPMRPPLQGSAKRTVLVGKVLVLLRGAPGSGKSTLARNLLEQNPTGVILSTDDYFLCDGHYQYDRSALGEAHEWTQKRAKETFKQGLSPIIIDNTNIQGWEMKPYVALALQYNYKVMFREPDTWWKYKPRELERHTKHGVPKEKIKRMLEQYQRYVTVQNIMGSTNPKATEQGKDVQPSQEQEGQDEGSNTLMKPDVVEEPHFKQQPANSDFKVKSLPEVSSVKENINTDDTTYRSSSNTHYLSNDSIRVEGQSKYPTVEDELKDKGSSDVALYLENEVSSKGIDSKNNEDLSDNTGGFAAREVPVAFCESIGQRVRRQRRGNQDKDHQSDLKTHETLVKSDQSNPEDDNACVGNNFTRPELLSFVGDWPTQQILGQRNQRSRGSQASQCAREETESHVDKRKDGKDRMGIELKKLLDLLQDASNSEKCEAPTGDVLEQEGSALCSDLEKFNLESNVDTEELCISSETSVSLEDCRPELLNFVEDWPTTASSRERQQRLRIQNVEEHPSIEEKKELVVVKENTTVVDISESDPNKSCDSVGGVESSLDRSESQIACTNQSVVKDTDRCIPPHSRDKKFKHIRRSGKQCKLALTFTNNSPPSLKSFDESPKTPQFDESPKTPQFEVIPDTVTKSVSLVSTQATSEDFAFLWRVENQKMDASGVNVLLGNANNFEPKCLDSTVLPELQQVPYRVDHDKGTQVEETEFDTDDKHNNLQILSEHFKSVSFDILQDLYEKCNQDMEWTTNLLLDSGEQLYKEDELVCTGLEHTETVELPTDVSHIPLDPLNQESSNINILDEHSASSADNLDDHEVLSEGLQVSSVKENINTDDTTYRSSSNTHYLSNDSIRVEGQSKYPTVEDELKDKGSSDVALYLENEVSSKGIDSESNEDLSDNTGGFAAREVPVAFCESIGQRVRRQRRGNQDKDHQSDLKTHETLVKSDQSNPEDDNACVGNNFTRPELLSFVGDWPTQQILGQRNQRSRGSQASQCAREETESHVDKRKDGKDRMGIELKKLLDLLQDASNSEKCEAPTGDVLEQEGSALCSDLEKFNLESNVDTEELCISSETSVSLEDCRPELLNFVEDWPTTASSRERQQRLRIQNVEEHPSIEEKKELVVVKENTTVIDISESDPNKSCDSVGGVESSLDRSESQIACTNQSVVKDTDRCIPPHSRDKKFKHIRRSGKQCKLALTFTNNSPPSLKSFDESPKTPQFEVIPDTVTKSVSLVSTQATSEDFAFLWRVENQKMDASGVKVLLGNANNFEPKCLDSTVLPELQQVPYRVDHDKGTQVEETEFDTDDKHNNLQILSEHFKSVSFDILQDLYEKCNQDMEWTTNLLLDSGEQLYKEDELVCTGLERTETVELPTGVSHIPLDPLNQESSNINILDEHSASSADNLDDHEVLSEGQPEVGIEKPADGVSVKTDFSVGLEDCTRQLTVEGGNSDCRTAMEAGTNKPMPEQSKQIIGEDTTLKDRLEAEAQCALSDIAETREGPGSLDPSLLLECPSGESEGESTEVVEHPTENQASSTLSSRPAQMPTVESPTKQPSQKSLGSLNIQSLELCLPPELAFQLSDLFGPVGIDPGTLSLEDCVVQIDLNLAKLIHQKWKEAIQVGRIVVFERQKQEVLSYQLLQENPLLSNDYQLDRLKGSWGGASVPGADGAFGQWESSEGMPFMDHWSAQAPHVSLKAIMSEEMALQEQYKKAKVNPVLGRKDGAAMLKEKQLFDTFPSIDRHFLMDIFGDNNYSLEQTEQFLKSLLDEGPVKTVVAQGSVHRSETPYPQKERRAKAAEAVAVDSLFQDTEDPDYDDYRTEALIQRRSQQECFSKAAEAYRKGMKEVATYYAQQGHLHGQQMKEANHRAAVRIFERVNASLLPQNVLDLHGLHVDEAIHHLKRVLQEKVADLLSRNLALCTSC
ncbi:UNVERIFIED_CONTAM: hypothetical protein FKN15_004857 [Acipenser sinensis]